MDSEHVPVKRFVTNLRVLVKKDEDGKEINAVGMVTRTFALRIPASIRIHARSPSAWSRGSVRTASVRGS